MISVLPINAASGVYSPSGKFTFWTKFYAAIEDLPDDVKDPNANVYIVFPADADLNEEKYKTIVDA